MRRTSKRGRRGSIMRRWSASAPCPSRSTTTRTTTSGWPPASAISAAPAIAKVARRVTDAGAVAALAEVEGYQKLLDGKNDEAFALFAKAASMRPEALARAHLAPRQFDKAESVAKSGVDHKPNQFPPL